LPSPVEDPAFQRGCGRELISPRLIKGRGGFSTFYEAINIEILKNTQ